MGQTPRYKELSGFEDLARFFELLQLAFGLLQLFFFGVNVVLDPVDLVEHDLDGRPFLPASGISR